MQLWTAVARFASYFVAWTIIPSARKTCSGFAQTKVSSKFTFRVKNTELFIASSENLRVRNPSVELLQTVGRGVCSSIDLSVCVFSFSIKARALGWEMQSWLLRRRGAPDSFGRCGAPPSVLRVDTIYSSPEGGTYCGSSWL